MEDAEGEIDRVADCRGAKPRIVGKTANQVQTVTAFTVTGLILEIVSVQINKVKEPPPPERVRNDRYVSFGWLCLALSFADEFVDRNMSLIQPSHSLGFEML